MSDVDDTAQAQPEAANQDELETLEGKAAGRAVNVLLAEFQALRVEINGRTASQAALVGIGLTAVGVVVGFVVKENGDERLWLALPPLAAVINLLWSIENRRVTLLGAYIRTVLWPDLRTLTNLNFSCWEDEVQARRAPKRAVFSLLAEGMLLLVFVGAGAVGALVGGDSVSGSVEAAGWVLVVVAGLVPLGFALENRRGG